MQTIFFSLDLVGRPASKTAIYHVKKQLKARGINNIIVIGSYKGQVEKSFRVEVKDFNDFNYIKLLCSLFEQESFLVVDNNQRAALHFVANGNVESIGTMVEVNKESAQKLDAWTYVPHTNQYFTCVGA